MATGRVPTTANSPLTAKGDLFGYSTTQARVPVGSDGETLVADSSASTGLSYSAGNSLGNRVINSGFDIWQRGTSISLAASTSAGYNADRWAITSGANQATTISRQSTNDTTNLPFIQYCSRVQRNSGQTGTGKIYYWQSFETAETLRFAGRQITLSFYARAGANYSPTSSALEVWLVTQTGTDQSLNAYTNFSTRPVDGSATLTTTWQRFTYTGTVASTANEMSISFNMNPTGTASTNDWFEVTGVQIDLGPVALPYRRSSATLAGEFLACQRYFQRFVGGLGLPYPAYSSGTTLIFGTVQMPIKMRTAPSITVGGTLYFFNSSAEVSAASPTVDFSSMYDGGGRLRLGGFTGLTSGLLTMAYFNEGHISLSAEL